MSPSESKGPGTAQIVRHGLASDGSNSHSNFHRSTNGYNRGAATTGRIRQVPTPAAQRVTVDEGTFVRSGDHRGISSGARLRSRGRVIIMVKGGDPTYGRQSTS